MLLFNNTNSIKSETEQNIDSIHIKVYQSNTLVILDYIKINNLSKYYNPNKHNKYGKQIVKKNNTILFSYYKQTSQYTSFNDYLMLEIHGLKKYNTEDQIKEDTLYDLLHHLKLNQVQYDIQKLDFSIDIKNIKLQNIFLYKTTKGKKINDISIHDISKPYILEQAVEHNDNRNNRCIIYDKKEKEQLESLKDELLRIEISLYPNVFRQIRKLDDDSLIQREIQKQIEKYQIFIISDTKKRNLIQQYHKDHDYKSNQRVRTRLEKLIQDKNTVMIDYDYSSRLQHFF